MASEAHRSGLKGKPALSGVEASLEALSPRAREIYDKLVKFAAEECDPALKVFEEQLNAQPSRWSAVPPVLEELKTKAKALGLWNLFLPKDYKQGAGLTNREYAVMAEVMGGSPLCSEACNCSAPDTGNMEVLAKFGSPEQQAKYLTPLMEGKIRSTFFMTEPYVASSDARNIESSIVRDGDEYIINGRKWWSSGVLNPHCKVGIFMGKTRMDGNPRTQQSMIIVPVPSPGLTIVRALTVFGYDDAPEGHGEVQFTNVRVPVSNLIWAEGKGFDIAQGRLGPGRIHHCMRAIGAGERCLQMLLDRATRRTAFGKPLARQGTVQVAIAESRIELHAARLMVLDAADRIDKYGVKGARKEIAMIKVFVPNAVSRVVDRAIQVHGGAGVCQDFPLARAYAGMRCLRIADGPDEVHQRSIAMMELKSALKSRL